MISTALTDLWYGFGVALEPHNLMYCFLGVLVGNLVGVLPGMGPVATISILLPLTFGMAPVPAILMLSGVYYGAQYGGAICSILLNLPCHPPHAVTCLDGFPLTQSLDNLVTYSDGYNRAINEPGGFGFWAALGTSCNGSPMTVGAIDANSTSRNFGHRTHRPVMRLRMLDKTAIGARQSFRVVMLGGLYRTISTTSKPASVASFFHWAGL